VLGEFAPWKSRLVILNPCMSAGPRRQSKRRNTRIPVDESLPMPLFTQTHSESACTQGQEEMLRQESFLPYYLVFHERDGVPVSLNQLITDLAVRSDGAPNPGPQADGYAPA